MNKQALFKKLQKLKPFDLEKIDISYDEINFIKNKLLNDKLGLKINFIEIDEKISKKYFGFKEIKEMNINSKDKENHLIIEGENYHALMSLKTANIKVDLLYIDPPYNTGKEFMYNDNYSTEIKVVGKDDAYKHSKWLSFMKKRLIIAKELLKDDGLIFVSIDDYEQAYLKVLMDEIFGENNFINSLPRTTRRGGGRYGKNYISNDLDYVLMYSNNLFITKEFQGQSRTFDDFKYKDERDYYTLKHPLDGGSGQPNYLLELEHEGRKYKPREGKNWSFSDKRVEWMLKENMMVFKENGMIYIKNYKNYRIIEENNEYSLVLKENKKGLYKSDLFNDKLYSNAEGTMDLDKLGLEFSHPKPVSLIKKILSFIDNENITVLDFFAGSGTTGQAVMELNQEDGGKRKFILITNNENNIAREICRERVYRVVEGKGSRKEKINWKYSKEIPSLKNNSIKYLGIKEIDKIEGNYEEINSMKDLYKKEFNKDISIKDFNE